MLKNSETNVHSQRRAVEIFYDQFFERRMSSYRAQGNARLDAAMAFIRPHLSAGQLVADIGCGVGVVTEALARALPASNFIGIDISEANIRNAREVVNAANAQFFCGNVIEEFDQFKARIDRPLDAICMVDVIEHIPEHDRLSLLTRLAEVAATNCLLLMTYPSPEYQRYLAEHDPGELQVVDNLIELEVILPEAAAAGWRLRYFRYVDVWKTNQYVHVVFGRDVHLTDLRNIPSSLLRRGARRLGKAMMKQFVAR